MKIHGNSRRNKKPHHLYEIRDSIDDSVFKYGISHEPIGSDGLSNRMRIQINFLNLGVNWERFFGRILIVGIANRIEARRLETQYIQTHRIIYGERPRGNLED